MRQGKAVFTPQIYRGKEGFEIATLVAIEIAKHKPDAVFIDGTGGYGGAVAERLRQIGHQCIEVQFGGKAADPRYANKRAEMWMEMAKFIKSGQQCRVRISTRLPLAMEKFEVLPQLGRFTLRDEGRTIAVGKILKYKPHKVQSSIQVAGTPASQNQAQAAATSDKCEALVFDMETGKESKAAKKLDAIAEE